MQPVVDWLLRDPLQSEVLLCGGQVKHPLLDLRVTLDIRQTLACCPLTLETIWRLVPLAPVICRVTH